MMPKQKTVTKKPSLPVEEEKIREIDLEKKIVDPELAPGEEAEEEDEDDALLDDEEIDPFKDRWEE